MIEYEYKVFNDIMILLKNNYVINNAQIFYLKIWIYR